MKSFTNWKNLREANRAASAVGGQRNLGLIMKGAQKTNRPGNAMGSAEAVEQFVQTVIKGNDPASQKAVLRMLRNLIKMFPALIAQELDAEEAAGNNAGKVR